MLEAAINEPFSAVGTILLIVAIVRQEWFRIAIKDIRFELSRIKKFVGMEIKGGE